MSWGVAIKGARRAAHVSQVVVCRALGVTQPTVSAWENDRSRPDDETIGKLEVLFGLRRGRLYEMAGLVPEPDPASPMAMAADGVDLVELRDLDPEGYETVAAQMRLLIQRARERRAQQT